MMQIFYNPERKDWDQLLQRPYQDNSSVLAAVQNILNQVKGGGDKALKELSKKFDGSEPGNLEVTEEELNEADTVLDESVKIAVAQAAENIRKFHQAQIGRIEEVETMPGIRCWRRGVGIEKVGLYIPGGTAPLFSTVLMLGIPAKLAGCKEIILCTPAGKNGKVHPAILFAAQLVGVTRIFKTGGAQAVAAMAYGTESVPSVYKIFGPGNQYVTAAKQMVQMQGVAIDMPAGPSEVCVLADETANASFVAADLLSQAEHGADSQVILVSTSERLIQQCVNEVSLQLASLPRKDFAQKALDRSKAFIVKNMEEAIDLVNAYAAEHLILSCSEADHIADQVINAGSVFIGNYSPESVGDYAAGTNHTLPTNGFARAYSGVSVDSFLKKITYQKLTQEGLNTISNTVITMAEAEGLEAHANAVRVRINR